MSKQKKHGVRIRNKGSYFEVEYYQLLGTDVEGHGYLVRWKKSQKSFVEVNGKVDERSEYGFKLHVACTHGWTYDVTEWGYLHRDYAREHLLKTMEKLAEAYVAEVVDMNPPFPEPGQEEGENIGEAGDTEAAEAAVVA